VDIGPCDAGWASIAVKGPHLEKDGKDMSVVWSCNEWDPLEEVIVGNPLRARFPPQDPSTRVAEFPEHSLEQIPTGPFSKQIVEETEEDLLGFVTVLEELGVKVRRPETWPHEARFSTIHWESEGYYNYCPRDILLVIGDQIIETPNVMRSRAQEAYSYRALLLEYLQAGARWYSAPKPMLLDSLFDCASEKPTPRNDEPAFDAANVLRLGKDLIYLVSGTGNALGGQWLQTILGDEFRVHFLEDVYYGSHIDSTLVALRPGLLLANPARVRDDTLPDILKQWKVIYSPPMVSKGYQDTDYLSKSIGSAWIDMNLLSINPNLVVVDSDQADLIKLLESNGLDVIPYKLRHARMLGGGFHCITLDVRRAGALERHFE
jgi:N-dimethylarginine dimethylaminohydrolase